MKLRYKIQFRIEHYWMQILIGWTITQIGFWWCVFGLRWARNWIIGYKPEDK